MELFSLPGTCTQKKHQPLVATTGWIGHGAMQTGGAVPGMGSLFIGGTASQGHLVPPGLECAWSFGVPEITQGLVDHM